MKKLTAVLVVALMVCLQAWPDTLINQTITLSATAVRVAKISTIASSIMIQMQPGSTSPGYVLYADPGTTCTTSNTNQIAATLSPGTASAPGSTYFYPTFNGNSPTNVDVSWFCVAGTSPDTVIVSYSKR